MILGFLFVILAAALVAAVFMSNALYATLRSKLPYINSPSWTIDAITRRLHLGPQDVFVELGCGDARVLSGVAKKFPAAIYIGYEIQWWPYLLAKWRCRNMGNVTITHQNFLRADLANATVIYGFFIHAMMPKVAELYRAQTKRPALISLGYQLPELAPSETIPNPNGRGSSLRWYSA